MDGGEVVAGAFAEVDGAMLAKDPARRLGHLAIGRQLLFRHRQQESVDITHLQPPGSNRLRSEEHTSELQSLMRISYAVFCLKKQKTKRTTYQHTPEINNHSHDAQKTETQLNT